MTRSFLTLPLPFPQHVFLNLSCGCFRKFVYKLDSPRTFESGEPLTTVRVQDLLSQSDVRFKDHERLRYLAKTLVRTGNNGHFQYSRMCVDDPLHFKAGNIFSA